MDVHRPTRKCQSKRNGSSWILVARVRFDFGLRPRNRAVDFCRHPLLRSMIWQQTLKRGTLVSAGKNRLRLCGDATWEGISRSIARQWYGQPRRVFARRDCLSNAHWTQEFMPEKSISKLKVTSNLDVFAQKCRHLLMQTRF